MCTFLCSSAALERRSEDCHPPLWAVELVTRGTRRFLLSVLISERENLTSRSVMCVLVRTKWKEMEDVIGCRTQIWANSSGKVGTTILVIIGLFFRRFMRGKVTGARGHVYCLER